MAVFILLFTCLLVSNLSATEQALPEDSLVSLRLYDGNTFTGRLTHMDDSTYTLVTPSGVQIIIPRTSVRSLGPFRGRMVKGELQLHDPNYTRLLFTPTARPLRRGDGYISDYYIIFPGVSYGLTNQISVQGGISFIPAVPFRDQAKFAGIKVGFPVTKQVSVAGGGLYVSVLGDYAFGTVFAVGTFGPKESSITTGIGYGYEKDEGNEFEFTKSPFIMVGGSIQLSGSIAFVSENWFITGKDFELSEQPLAQALRFYGRRIAVDLGVIIIGEVIEHGVPIPWLSFVYNFGGSRAMASRPQTP